MNSIIYNTTKKLYIIVACIILVNLPINGHSQQAKFNASFGLSMSQIDNDGMSGYHKNGLTLGLMTQFPLKKSMTWSVGLKYVNKGSKKIYGDQGPIGGNGQWERATLQYVDVPLTFTYIYKKKFYGSTGPVAGILAGGNIEFTPYTKYDARNTFKRLEVAWNFVVGYKISDDWSFQISSEASIISANKGNNYVNVSKYSGYLNNIILIELVRSFSSK